MKSLLHHPFVLLVARVLLGGLFIIASLDKIVDPGAFALSILKYKLVGQTLALAAATVIPWMELLAGIGLLLGILPRGAALLGAALLAVFTILVAVSMARGLDIACGCFSQDPSVGHVGWQKVIENIILFLLALVALFSRAELTFLDRLTQRGRAS